MINNREKDYLRSFGRNLRKLRKAKGISQLDLAFKADINKNQVGNIERGEVNTTISTLFRIAKALEVDPKDLLDFESKDPLS